MRWGEGDGVGCWVVGGGGVGWGGGGGVGVLAQRVPDMDRLETKYIPAI